MYPTETSILYGLEAGASRIVVATGNVAAALKPAMALALLNQETSLPTASAALPSREGLGLLWEQGPYGESHGTRTDPLQRPAPRDAAIGQSRGQVVEVGRTLRTIFPCGSPKKGSVFRLHRIPPL
jgi:hypothetical protein